MSDIIIDRIKELRFLMDKHQLSAYIIPSSDPHLSEYVADHWKLREWISDFTGSAGTVVVLGNKAGLWTDSRYYLQAAEQLKGTGIELFKDSLTETPSFIDWICSEVTSGSTVGIDGEMFSISHVEAMREKLEAANLTLKTDVSLINDEWAELPPLPKTETFLLENKYTGKGIQDKLKEIRLEISKKRCHLLLLSALDEISWTFNLRSSDIEYNPVIIAFALISQDSAYLFTNKEKLTDKAFSELSQCNVTIIEYHNIYHNIYKVLSEIPARMKILIDKDKTNYSLYNSIQHKESVVFCPSPVILMKAVKNETELNGVHNAMIKDGIALTEAFCELEKEVKKGNFISEMEFAERLKARRAAQPDFFCESFGTIAGYGPHGAIVHYSATKGSNVKIKDDNLLLVDSGANYFDGTTDITRTFSFGTPTEKQKHDYTNVLKGHIALASIHFPKGTRGSQLDVLAHQYLWNEGLTYGHGAGHGIGHFLCVHEGPQNIRPNDNGVKLQEGMLLSNEPGLYRTNEYGIRIENMILVQKSFKSDDFGEFLCFETLTLFPYDRTLIDKKLLTNKEIEWINNYHQTVFSKLGPLLSTKYRDWLKTKTQTI